MNDIQLEVSTLEGRWSEVVEMYEKFPEAHTATITNSVGNKTINVGTALHVAIELNEEEVVKKLLKAIIKNKHGRSNKPLKVVNESGDTPLHVAASRGYERLCKLIVGGNKERVKLVKVKNGEGETPLFLAALNWSKKAFAYLSDITRSGVKRDDLVRNNGDSILHCAIKREFFDLAVIIMTYYDFLSTHKNDEGFTPLKVLATRSSAFKSSTRFSGWMRIMYDWILVEPLNGEREMRKLVENIERRAASQEKYPMNYATLFEFSQLFKGLPHLFGKQRQNPSNEGQDDPEKPQIKQIMYQSNSFPPNYITSQQFIKSVYMLSLRLSGVADLKELIGTKKKHQWSSQLLDALMIRPYEAFTGRGAAPEGNTVDEEMYGIMDMLEDNEWSMTPQQQVTDRTEEGTPSRLESEKSVTYKPNKTEENVLMVAVRNRHPLVVETQKIALKTMESKEVVFNNMVPAANGDEDTLLHLVAHSLGINESEKAEDLNETPFLLAARNGIVEMVSMILKKIPSAIHNTNAKKENVLMVAVKSRQPLVVETLKTTLTKVEKTEDVWNNLILAANDDENTMLHLAAQALGEEKPWQIAGSALQMMWDIKWYEYIKRIVPEHFYFRSNKNNKTAGEIFKESHKKLVEESSTWLKDTSESCSVVAALVAGVSFATASSVPGGTNDQGEPPLEGQPAFDAFAISSLIGLCFSVTGLIMFLTILTSRKEAKDFRKGLPMKLLLGLSSLFVAIVAMFVAFSAGHELIVNHKYRRILIPFYAATSVPVGFYAVAQFPLYIDLLKAIQTSVPQSSDKGDDL